MTQNRYDLDFVIGETPGDVWAGGLEDRFEALSIEVTNAVETYAELPDAGTVEQSSNGQWPVYVVTGIPLVVRVTDQEQQIIGGLGNETNRLPKQFVEAVDATGDVSAASATITNGVTAASAAIEGQTETGSISNKDYNESVEVYPDATGTVTLDLAQANIHRVEAVDNVTIDIINASASPDGNSLVVYLTDSDGLGPYTVSWTPATKWARGDVADEIGAASNIEVGLISDDGGTEWRGRFVEAFE